MALTAKLTLKLAVTFDKTVGLTTAKAPINSEITLADLADGTGADKADTIWTSKDRTLAGSGSEEIDIFDLAIDGGAAGEDAFGDAIANVAVKALVIVNKNSTDGDTLQIGGPAGTATSSWASPFNDDDSAKIEVEAGGALVLTAPKANGINVTDTDDHILKVTNASGNQVKYDIYVIGATATS